MGIDDKKKVFISYSHSDRPFVEDIANRMNASGVPLWWDKWDIQPGDSIVRKIFEEGLADCELFVVVLSKTSVASKWVQEELDAATIRRIEGVAKIVPVLKEDCEIPMSLRALMWVDLRRDVEDGVRKIVNLYFGVTERPPVGPLPTHVKALAQSVGGLSPVATTVSLYLLRLADPDEGIGRSYRNDAFGPLGLSPTELNDAIEELEDRGLVHTLKVLGTHPFHFGSVAVTYAMYLHFAETLPYGPEDDIRIVAAAVSATDQINSQELQGKTGLSAGRLNRAVEYLQDYGLAHVVKVMGTAPFTFGFVTATRHTRAFAAV